MNKLVKIVLATISYVCLTASANAAVITLDFDSAGTGLNILSSPLVTSEGTITASNVGGRLFLTSGSPMVGNALRFDQDSDSDYALLAFDFDVVSIEFLYAGYVSGVFTAEALDASSALVDSFFDADTDNDMPGNGSVNGTGIRFFKFADFPGGGSFAGVDSLIITTAADIPEPTTLAVLGLGLAGLFAGRRQRKA